MSSGRLFQSKTIPSHEFMSRHVSAVRMYVLCAHVSMYLHTSCIDNTVSWLFGATAMCHLVPLVCVKSCSSARTSSCCDTKAFSDCVQGLLTSCLGIIVHVCTQSHHTFSVNVVVAGLCAWTSNSKHVRLHRAPVFRGLYAEKKVIEEERRLRVDDAPLGR